MKGKLKTGIRLLLALALVSMAAKAQAVNTASGTSIDNTATINYKVSGVSQTAVSDSYSFVVDNKVDLTVAGGGTNVVGGAANQVLQFTVANIGNTAQDYDFSAANAGGDDFDVTINNIFVESGATVGYQVAEDTTAFIDELAAGSSKVVYVIATIPAASNGQTGIVTLTAETHDAGVATVLGAASAETGAADVPGTVEVVFADGTGVSDLAEDGEFSANGTFTVVSAVLTVTKSSTVISDPYSPAGQYKAIPGATIEYTVSVSNGGPADVTEVALTDDLSTEIGNGYIAYNANTIKVTAPNINGGAEKALTDAIDADEGQFQANTVTVTGINLLNGESATIKYRVTIQ